MKRHPFTEGHFHYILPWTNISHRQIPSLISFFYFNTHMAPGYLFQTWEIRILQVILTLEKKNVFTIESGMPSRHLIRCRPLLLLPPIPPSIRVFSNESTLPMKWPKYWSFSFSIIPSKETPGLISFRMDWLDLLAVQGTLKSLLQHHSSKASILRRSAFFHSPTLTAIHDHRKNHSLD